MDQETLLSSRYKIEEHIGRGGMADVYRAQDLMLERMVAVKILRADLSSMPSFRDNFRQEARSAANLSHPSIVTIYDFGFDDEQLFLVMEYIAGSDLKSILQSHGRFTINQALPLLIQACAGLAYAHRSGLIHCDIKSHNLIVTPDSRLKITDFGIARALTSLEPDQNSDIVWGSPQYFSPEQASGLTLSPATDVYSLGVVMYEMLTGRLPFDAPTSAELALLHRTVSPPLPRDINPAITQEVEDIILKALSKNPSTRFRTADQLGRVLMSVNKSAVSTSQTTSPSLFHRWFKRPFAPSTQPNEITLLEPQPVPTKDIPQSSALDIDWITWGLVLLTLIAVGGLIPLWLWVYLLYFASTP